MMEYEFVMLDLLQESLFVSIVNQDMSDCRVRGYSTSSAL